MIYEIINNNNCWCIYCRLCYSPFYCVCEISFIYICIYIIIFKYDFYMQANRPFYFNNWWTKALFRLFWILQYTIICIDQHINHIAHGWQVICINQRSKGYKIKPWGSHVDSFSDWLEYIVITIVIPIILTKNCILVS